MSLAHRIAGEGACAQAHDIGLLQRRAIALVNAGRVPAALQEPLTSAVGALAEQKPLCLPAATTPSSPATSPPPKSHEHHKRGHHGHGHGHDE